MLAPTPALDAALTTSALFTKISNAMLDRSAQNQLTPAQEAQRSLFEVFADIPDPRSRHGRRHSLNSLLSMLVVALCGGANHVKNAVIFGRERKALRKRLGFTHRIAPSQSTYTRLFQRLAHMLERYPFVSLFTLDALFAQHNLARKA